MQSKSKNYAPFIHGISYGYAFRSPTQWESDIRKMLQLQLNAVRIAEFWPSWSVFERSESQYDWESLEAFLEVAEEHGLNVCLGVGINDTPMWMFEKYPDLRAIEASSGSAAQRRVSSACFDHKDYRREMQRFVEAYVSNFDRFPSVVSWQFGNELRYGVGTCDCESTRVGFREYLKRLFADSIDALNVAWGTSYPTFDSIYPYGSGKGAPTGGITALWMETRRHQINSLESFVKWGCGLIKSISCKPVFHNNYSSMGQSGSTWKLSEPCDIVVQDLYPTTSDEPAIYNGFYIDLGRSVALQQNKPLMIGETPAGDYGSFLRKKIDRRLAELCLVEQIASGISGMYYFHLLGSKWEQQHKFTGSQAFFRNDGSATEHVETLDHTGALLRFLRNHDFPKTTRSEVGIFFTTDTMTLGEAAGFFQDASDALMGMHRWIRAAGYEVELFDANALLDSDLATLKVLFLPMAWSLPESVCQKLSEFVKAGGILISEARPAYADANGHLYSDQPGGSLSELFGLKEKDFGLIENQGLRWKTQEGEPDPKRVRFGVQCFREINADVLASDLDENPVVCIHRYGKGKACMIGTYPSLNYRVGRSKYVTTRKPTGTPEQQMAWVRWLNDFLKHEGISPLFDSRNIHPLVTCRRLFIKGSENSLLVCMNYDKEASKHLRLSVEAQLGIASEGVRLEKDGQLILPAYGWAVVHVTRDDFIT